MNETSIAECLDIICGMSDRQVDDKIKPRLLALKNRPLHEIKDELLGIIDDCVFSALTSDLIIYYLDTLWKGCGGTEGELRERNTRLPQDKELLREKYKWRCQ